IRNRPLRAPCIPSRTCPPRGIFGAGALSGRTEAAAAELTGVDQSDEERIEGVVLPVARLAEAAHGVLAQRTIHDEALLQDVAPLVGEILGLDRVEARASEQPAIARERLQRDGGHPVVEPRALEIAQARVRDPVAEGEAAAAGRKKTCGASQAGTDVKDAGRRRDPGAPRQRVDRAQAAVVVLVEGEEVVGGEPPVGAPARAADGVEDLALADRMAVIEVE